MNYEKIITGLLSKAYKLDDGEIAELLNAAEGTEDTKLAALLEKDTTRVRSLKETFNTEGKFQEGYAKAKKEERSLFETELKEKLGVQSDLKGLELVEHIVTVKGAGKGKGQITDEDVKSHPVYQQLDTKVKTLDQEWKTKLEQAETGFKKKETFISLKDKALTILDGLKPILPSSPDVANSWKNTFVGSLEGYDYEDVNGKTIVKKDGKVVEDLHGNTLTFEELVKGNASKYFEFQKSNGGGNPGGTPPAGGGNGGGSVYPTGVTKPATFADLEKIMNDPEIKTADKEIIMEVYDKENAPAK